MLDRGDIAEWSARDVARLLALIEAQLGYHREIAAALPIPIAVISSNRTLLWSNPAFRKRFGSKVPERGFTEIQIRTWHSAEETETLLVLEPPQPTIGVSGGGLTRDLPGVVWQADTSTLEFRSVDGDAEALLGYPASHWLSQGDFFEQRIHPDDRAATMELYRRIFDAGGEASAEYRAVSSTGETIWCRESIRATGLSLNGVITNINSRKQLERQLLSGGRFEALYGFAGRLAHDLNNPLMIVTGYAEELMQALKPTDPLRQDAAEVLAAARRISGISAQLTEFARREGKSASNVNLGEAITSLRPRIAAAAGEKVAVEVIANAKPIWALANPAHFAEVLAAVVAGPRKSTPRERTRIIISWDVEMVAERLSPTALAPGMYARITIRDDGHGLEAEQAAGVFDPVLVKTGDAAPAASAPTLARAYSLVHEWGGDIGFASEPGHGNAFAIYLPYVEPEGTALARPTVRQEPRASETAPTILVVEDESGIRELIRKILQRERYRVLEAGTAEAALALTPGQSIDLLITDVLLPGIHGPELARRMQQSAPKLKTLFISGFTGEAEVPAGARFLSKPFTLAMLLEKVRAALE